MKFNNNSNQNVTSIAACHSLRHANSLRCQLDLAMALLSEKLDTLVLLSWCRTLSMSPTSSDIRAGLLRVLKPVSICCSTANDTNPPAKDSDKG